MRVERAITLPVEPEEVWAAVVDPGRLGAWLGGDAPLEVDLDVEAGATGTVRAHGAPARHVRIDVVERRRRVRFQWWPEDGSGPLSEVDLEIDAVGEGTRLRVVETFVAPAPLPPEAPRRHLGFQLRARALVGV